MIKISSFQIVVFLLLTVILSVFSSFIYFNFPNFNSNDFLFKIFSLLMYALLGYTLSIGFPGSLMIKIESNLLFNLLMVFFGSGTIMLSFYFGQKRASLYNLIDDTFLHTLVLYITYLIFAFGFAILSNTMLWRFGHSEAKRKSLFFLTRKYSLLMAVFSISRIILPFACHFIFHYIFFHSYYFFQSF